MVMKAFRQGASGGITKFILFGLMTLAVGGLVFTNVGGFFRNGGITSHDVVKVGHDSLSINIFDRNLRQATARMNMTPQQAYKAGFANQLLDSEVQSMTFEHAARDQGLLVSPSYIAGQVAKMVMPMVQPGQNPKDVLHQALAGQGINEKEFVDNIGKQTAAGILTSVIQSGFAGVNNDMIRDLYKFQKETRDIDYVTFPDMDVKNIKAPTDDEISALYELRKQSFALPETRVLKIIRIKDDAFKKTAPSDEELRKSYDSAIDTYKTGEERIFEQAIINSEAKAQAIIAAKPSDLKAAVQKETGTANDYLGEGNLKDAKILPEIKQKIAAATEEGQIIGPIKSPLGWHVIRIKKITPAGTKKFEDVKQDIAAEMQDNQISEERDTLANTVEDRLASGASLEEINKDVPLDIVTLPPVTHAGLDANGKDALAVYKTSRQSILDAGFDLDQGSSSPMMELADNSFVAVYLETLKPQSYRPLSEVAGDLKKKWMDDQQKLDNRIKVNALLEILKGGKTSLKKIAAEQGKAFQSLPGLSRVEVKKPLTDSAMMAVFDSAIPQPLLLDIDGGVALAVVRDAHVPDTIDTNAADYKKLADTLPGSLQNDGLMAFMADRQAHYGVRVNKRLLDATYNAPDPDNAAQ